MSRLWSFPSKLISGARACAVYEAIRELGRDERGGLSHTRARWNPRHYGGCVLWLDASVPSSITLVSGVVSQWSDLSGAAHHFTQGTAGSRPLSGIDFDGTDDYLSAAGLGATLFPTTGTWFIVFETDAIDTNAAAIYDNDGLLCDSWPAGFVLKSAPTVHAWRYDGAGARVTTHNIATSTRYVLACTSTGDSGALSSWLNNADPQTISLGTITAAAANAFIGTNYAGAVFLDGRVYEVAVYNRALSTVERLRASRALGAKWGVAVA